MRPHLCKRHRPLFTASYAPARPAGMWLNRFPWLHLATYLSAAILLGVGFVARGQVDISANLEIYRTNRHMPGLMAVCIKSGRIMAARLALHCSPPPTPRSNAW